ncbi:MAG: cytochrome c biogenesis protein ResB [Bdellovibrionaceae bacterium]|nr:cytochrome c biogenesis protein ResB [Pseudobdellovibrionaceae bacterium]
MSPSLNKWFNKFIKQLSSLKLAVFVILSLAVISAVGTIYEAKYDATYAQKTVYTSIYMKAVLGLLCINLIFVMVDRWPWKKHHTGFVLAHIGIIIMLIGAFITEKFGIDGSMAFPLGESNRFITVSSQEVNIFASYDNGNPTRVFARAVDFFKDPPTEEKPLVATLGNQEMKITDYYHYAIGKEEFVAGEKINSGPALRVQLQNKFVNMTQWLFKTPGKKLETISLGPAQIVIHDGDFKYEKGNVLSFQPLEGDRLAYKVYLDRTQSLVKSGIVKAGESFNTGWMDATLRLLKYIPNAQRKLIFVKRESPTPRTRSAILVEYNGEKQWVGLNSVIKFFDTDKVYYFSFGNRRIDLGYDIQLADFRVGKYQGTNRAMSYESVVKVPELGEVLISMNEPMKNKGYTFYQASFEQDEQGNPTTSILSVNKDPGRPIKYLGSFLIVLGSIILFYFKRMKFKEMFKRGAHE